MGAFGGWAGFLHGIMKPSGGGIRVAEGRVPEHITLKCQGCNQNFIAEDKIRKNYFMIRYTYVKISMTGWTFFEYIDS
jgi:hypothetical protein